jgi:hypothetical protein
MYNIIHLSIFATYAGSLAVLVSYQDLGVGILVGIFGTVKFWQELSFDNLAGTPFRNHASVDTVLCNTLQLMGDASKVVHQPGVSDVV